MSKSFKLAKRHQIFTFNKKRLFYKSDPTENQVNIVVARHECVNVVKCGLEGEGGERLRGAGKRGSDRGERGMISVCVTH